MMYLEHFGLERSPFKITPDTSLFYTGNKRGAALEALKYAILAGEGIIKVVGEVGSGKTMLCRMLEVELPDHIEIVYIANPSLSPDDILHVIALELKLEVNNQSSKLEVMQKLHTYLLEKHAKNKQVVLFVEEAQSMPLETLEEIRFLSNLETSEHKLLQMVLFGQPELDEKLREPNIRQLKERITHSFYLEPFPPKDIYEYLNYRMRAVGYRGPDIFSPKVASNIEKKSHGLTRRINILADKALLAVYSEGGHGVATKHIKIAAEDSDFEQIINWKPWLIAAIVAIGLAMAVWVGTLISALILNDDTTKNLTTQSDAQKLPLVQPKLEAENILQTYSKKPVGGVSALLTKRLEISEGWLNEAELKNFTIQLALFDAWVPEKVNQFLQNVGKSLNMKDLYVYEATIRGKKMYSILYNDYESWDVAVRDLQYLPKSLKVHGPYLRTIKAIRYDINAGNKTIN